MVNGAEIKNWAQPGTLELHFRKAVKHDAKLRLAISGPSGSGKTYTMLKIASELGGPVALVDTEHGSASKYADLFEFDVLELDSYDPGHLLKIIDQAAEAGFRVLCIDSLSHFWMGKDGELEMVDRAARRMQNPNSFAALKQVTPIHNALIDKMIGASLHILASMRTKTEWILDWHPREYAKLQEVDSAAWAVKKQMEGTSVPHNPSTIVTIPKVDVDARRRELERRFRADAQDLTGGEQEIARLSGAVAARGEGRGRPIAEAEREAPPNEGLELPLGMRIDPRTTELRASLRAEYERSGRPPLDGAYNADPMVSVVIPCYNYGYYLEDAILSAMMACSHPMEILVVDDGSTDEGALGAVEDLAGRYHFCLLRQRNTGQNGARSEGFRNSRGKFIQFLDADDLLAPGKIDLQVDLLTDDGGIDIAVCEYEICDADGEGRRLMTPSTLAGFAFTAHDFLLRWERSFSLPIHCALFRREVLNPEQFPCITKAGMEDWIFWIVVASESPRFHFHPDVLAVYRIHGQNTSFNREGMGIDFLRASMYVLQAGYNSCDSFLEESIDHFRKAYLGSIKHEAETSLARAMSQAAHYKNLVDELQQKHTDAETRLARAVSQAAHYKNLMDELQQKHTDAETRLARAVSQAAHYKNLGDELQQKHTADETRLAQAASQAESQAAQHKTLLEEQRQRRIDLDSLRASYQAVLFEGMAFRQSLSWRITAPLRYLGSVLRFR